MALTIPVIVRSFRDLDLTFQLNPLTKDVATKVDSDAIKASIKNLVLTMNYERPFHPEIGSPIYGMLFELVSPMTARVIETIITQTINNLEPRATLNSVDVVPNIDANNYLVVVNFSIINYSQPFEVTVLLQHLR